MTTITEKQCDEILALQERSWISVQLIIKERTAIISIVNPEGIAVWRAEVPII